MRYRYLRDPLFLTCLVLYFVNRIILRPLIHHGSFGAFLHGSLNDLICIPFWIPIMVWLGRRTGLRATDGPPTGLEIVVALIVWSWWFEVMLPSVPAFKRIATADPSDVLCYATGALAGGIYWKWLSRLPSKEKEVPEAAHHKHGA